MNWNSTGGSKPTVDLTAFLRLTDRETARIELNWIIRGGCEYNGAFLTEEHHLRDLINGNLLSNKLKIRGQTKQYKSLATQYVF